MLTPAHKETAPTHQVSTISSTATSHIELTATQAVADTSDKPSPGQPLLAPPLPNSSSITHAGQETVVARGVGDPGNNGSDPSKHGDNANASVTDLTSPADALRTSALADPTVDPTKHDSHDDLIRGSRPSEATLRSELGLPAAASQPDPNNHESSDAPASGRPARPDGSGDDDPLTNQDADHSRYEGMLAADGQEGRSAVQKEIEKGTFGKQVPDIVGGNSSTPAGQELQTSHLEEDFDNGRVVVHSNGGVTSYRYTDGSKIIIVDSNNGTTTTLNKADNSSTTTTTDSKGHTTTTTTPAPSIPDEDHQNTFPGGLPNLVKSDIESSHRTSHDNDARDVIDTDIPGTVSMSNINGPVGDVKGALLGGDRGGVDGNMDVGGGGPGPRSTSSDTINNLDQLSQGTGPDERDTYQPIKTDPTGHNNSGQHGGGTGQNGTDSHQVSTIAAPVETAFHRAAGELELNSSPQGTTDKNVPDIHANDHVASILGSVPGSVGGGHATGAFAELIRLAQNPVQPGLVPAAHDAIPALQSCALNAAEPAGAPHSDGAHLVLSTSFDVAFHDEHSHPIVPTVDHGHL